MKKYLIIVTTLIAQSSSTAAQGNCYNTDEFLAEATSNFQIGQTIGAMYCDILIENTENPVKRKFITLNKIVLDIHDEKLKSFLKPLDNYIERNQITVKEYMTPRLAKLIQFYKSYDLKETQCNAFYDQLLKRKISWESIFGLIMVEYTLAESVYEKCKEE